MAFSDWLRYSLSIYFVIDSEITAASWPFQRVSKEYLDKVLNDS